MWVNHTGGSFVSLMRLILHGYDADNSPLGMLRSAQPPGVTMTCFTFRSTHRHLWFMRIISLCLKKKKTGMGFIQNGQLWVRALNHAWWKRHREKAGRVWEVAPRSAPPRPSWQAAVLIPTPSPSVWANSAMWVNLIRSSLGSDPSMSFEHSEGNCQVVLCYANGQAMKDVRPPLGRVL